MHAVDGVSFTLARGRDARPRRRVRQRQVDGRALRPAADRADGGHDPAATASTSRTSRPARDAAAAARPAHGLPGSVLVAESAHDGRRRSSASRCGSTGVASGRDARRRGRARCSSRSGSRAELRAPLPARALGRAAPARRPRARARSSGRTCSSPTSPCRRSTCRCRRRSSTCCATCSASSASRALHHARSRDGRVPLRPRGRDVPRPDRRAADRRQLFAQPQHPYTQALLSAAVVPDPAVQRTRGARRARRRHAEPLDTAVGLPLPHALPAAMRGRPRLDEEEPVLREFAPGHFVACHLVSPGAPAPRLVDTGVASSA